MNKLMLLFLFPMFLSAAVHAQINEDIAHVQAFDFAKKGEYQKALEILDRAIASAPNAQVLLRDRAYYTYMNADYDKAIALSSQLVRDGIADEQAFQILGSSYKMAKRYDKCIDAYGQGIALFPKSAVLYAELGDAYAANKQPDQAITVWEKGVKIDPNISSNYYHLSKAFAAKQNALRALLYAEVFINMENKTNRTIEMRNLMLEQYKVIFSNATYLNKYINGNNEFESLVAAAYRKFDMVVADGVTPESLSALRGQFIVNWYLQGLDQKFPFVLFDRGRMMLKLGTYDAYNRWLFSGYNPEQFKMWASTNEGQMNEFTRYFNVSVLKFSDGWQNYF